MTDYHTISAILNYDPSTGILSWKKPGPKRVIGARAGTLVRGRRRVMLNYKLYPASHLAWLLFYGEWPKTILDHKDKDSSNDRITNLRESNSVNNGLNMKIRKDSELGIRGVSIDKRTGKYSVRIHRKFYGTFESLETAKQIAEIHLWNLLQNKGLL